MRFIFFLLIFWFVFAAALWMARAVDWQAEYDRLKAKIEQNAAGRQLQGARRIQAGQGDERGQMIVKHFSPVAVLPDPASRTVVTIL